MSWVEIGWLLVGFLFGVTVLRAMLPYAYRFGLKIRFWARHGRKGKSILFVYSDSSNWRDHIETRILPRIEPHSVILNWSKRREWESRMQLEMKLFDQSAGSSEFSPVAIVLSPFRKTKVIRLWPISQDDKRAKTRVIKEAEQELLKTVESFRRGTVP